MLPTRSAHGQHPGGEQDSNIGAQRCSRSSTGRSNDGSGGTEALHEEHRGEPERSDASTSLAEYSRTRALPMAQGPGRRVQRRASWRLRTRSRRSSGATPKATIRASTRSPCRWPRRPHGAATEVRARASRARRPGEGAHKATERARGPKPVPLAQPRGELAGLLTVGYPKTRVSDMVAAADTLRTRLERVLTEQHERDRLREHGFSPSEASPRRAARDGQDHDRRALAGELGLPLFAFSSTGSSRSTWARRRRSSGSSSTRSATRGVYLFDEFDALGGERGRQNDVGEIRRVLNSFLQFLEQDDSDSLVVARDEPCRSSSTAPSSAASTPSSSTAAHRGNRDPRDAGAARRCSTRHVDGHRRQGVQRG